MPTPPVHHPRDPNYETRVRAGLAVVTLGMVLPLASERVRTGTTPSLLCYPQWCPTEAQLLAYLLAVPAVLGVTLWWWTHHDVERPRAVASAELVALAGLTGWWVLVPAHPGLLLVLVGGFVTALGTGGLFEDGRDATPLTTRLTGTGGVVVWSGFLAVAVTGHVPYVLPALFLPVLAGFLVLCASPLTWRRAHVLVFAGVATVAFLPWRLVDPANFAEGDDAIASTTGSLVTYAPDSPPEQVVFLCTVVGVTLILAGALGEITVRAVPSFARRMRPDTLDA